MLPGAHKHIHRNREGGEQCVIHDIPAIKYHIQSSFYNVTYYKYHIHIPFINTVIIYL